MVGVGVRVHNVLQSHAPLSDLHEIPVLHAKNRIDQQSLLGGVAAQEVSEGGATLRVEELLKDVASLLWLLEARGGLADLLLEPLPDGAADGAVVELQVHILGQECGRLHAAARLLREPKHEGSAGAVARGALDHEGAGQPSHRSKQVLGVVGFGDTTAVAARKMHVFQLAASFFDFLLVEVGMVGRVQVQPALVSRCQSLDCLNWQRAAQTHVTRHCRRLDSEADGLDGSL
mmetsp:Transcript_89959/g.188084  ORF Transcript_89959/g.188084 Transcript_89959/m.188084 type:complete len:232 (-) Transcript_89959:1593-2288(-)